jgi:hypothetical protein
MTAFRSLYIFDILIPTEHSEAFRHKATTIHNDINSTYIITY